MQAFPNSPKYVTELADTHFLKLTSDLVKKSEAYRGWISSTESSLLFLSGATAYEGRRYTGWPHSWLSPAAIYITEDLAREDIHAVFFSCTPGHESRIVPPKQLVSSIILQVLKKKPQILREKAVQFHNAALSDAIQNSSNTKAQTREMIRLLRDVLAQVKDVGTTFIILDRLDLCEGKISVLMDEFAKLVGDLECNVKIAAIAETSTGRGQWHLDQLPDDEYKADRVLSCQNWNQLRLTTVEINKRERPWLWREGSTLTWDDEAN